MDNPACMGHVLRRFTPLEERVKRVIPAQDFRKLNPHLTMPGHMLPTYNTGAKCMVKHRRNNHSSGAFEMVDIKALYELQLVDMAIREMDAALADVRARLADDSELKKARERLKRLEAQFEKVSAVRRSFQASADVLAEKLSNVEKRLYGGTITNPRELGAYEEEREMVRRQRSGEEDKLLEVMVQFEDVQENRDKAQATLERLESERTEHTKEWTVEEERLVSELDTQNGLRGRMAPDIPPVVLATYEMVSKARAGYAVAKVERGACLGCRILLPTKVEQQARTSDAVVQCSSCHRILYVD